MKKILVIEEQPYIRNLFLECLKAKDFYIISAENGRVGVQQAQEQLPDLIICEIVLPELNGYRVLTRLRGNPLTAIIPFICVAAKWNPTDLRIGMDLGANDYLTKPCTLEQLLRAIATQLKQQTLPRQCYAAQSQPVPEPPSADTATFAFAPQLVLQSDPPLNDVFSFIEANYHRPIALSDVAQEVGYSPAYLTNLTRRHTGQTVQRWIIERRMAAARSLLLETDQIVERIAAKVGYQHAVHFFRQFRKLHGTTPQAWRSAHRN